MNKKIIVSGLVVIAILLAILLAFYSAGKKQPVNNKSTSFGDQIGNNKDWAMVYTSGMPFSFKAPKGWFAYPGNTPANLVIANKDDMKSTAPDSVFMEVQGNMTKTGATSTLDYVKANLVNTQAKGVAYGTTESGLTVSKFENIKGTPGSGTAYAVDLSPSTFAFIVIERNGNPVTAEQIVQSIFLPIQ